MPLPPVNQRDARLQRAAAEGMMKQIMQTGRAQQVEFLVVGCGVAGLRAAIELASHGNVLVLTKSDPYAYAVRHASHDFAPPADSESASVPIQETIRQGDGLCRESAVHILAEEGPQQVRQLREWSARPESKGRSRHGAGETKRAPDVPDSAQVRSVLLAKALTLPSLRIKARSLAVELLVENGRVAGAAYLDEGCACRETVRCQAVLISTGGFGQVFSETTSSVAACGDGIALAFRAGALLSDLEFVQFHPTALYSKAEPRVPLPAGLREEGALLRNIALERFMRRYHDAGELAPPDVISRAILCEMQKERSSFVYLDLTGLDPELVKKRFPRVHAACMASNIDITSDLVPVRPAAHFVIGGIATALDGATSLSGLFAAGESASTGVHGGNRTANNSLLESLVFGARAAKAMSEGAGRPIFPAPRAPFGAAPLAADKAGVKTLDRVAIRREIRRIMWENAGIIRRQSSLVSGAEQLRQLTLAPSRANSRESIEIESMLTVARVVTQSAEARKESRGAHYRADFPLRNDAEPARHSFTSNNQSVYFAC